MYHPVACCPACKNPAQRAVGKVRDALVLQILRQGGDPGLPEIENTLVQCTACDLVYLSPRPDEPMLKRIYASWYGDIYRLSDTEKQARIREFKHYHWRLLAPYVPQNASLLDIGTGNGLFLSAIEGQALSAFGLEWDAGAVAQAQANLREASVHQGTLSHLPAEWASDERFDVITMFDYLEHTTTVAEDLAQVHRLLKPQGVLALRVPNYRGLQGRCMGRAWFGILSVHLSYFDRASLRRALEVQGFEVDYVYTGNFQTFDEILSQPFLYAWRKLFAKSGSGASIIQSHGVAVETYNTSRFGNALAFAKSTLLLWLDACGGMLGMGNNLYMIARKK